MAQKNSVMSHQWSLSANYTNGPEYMLSIQRILKVAAILWSLAPL
jgi:hypothetical protein